MRYVFLSLLIVTGISLATALPASAHPTDALADEAVDNLCRYIRIDTTNPPGNELAACQFLKALLDKEGIPSTLYESAPGRANLYAVLKGSDRSLGSLILLSHTDVVPADARYWAHPPFGGQIIDGEIWGRGTMDMKGMGMVELEALVALKRARVAIKRDLVFLAVADEEMGADAGVKWLYEQHPELFSHVAGVIDEEGPGYLENGRLTCWEIRPGQKALVWLKLVARGAAGHGSLPMADAAPNRLVRALAKVVEYQTPLNILPEARRYFTQIAALYDKKRGAQLRDLSASLKDAEFKRWFSQHPAWNAMVRDTISLTRLDGSNKTNVIPAEASAALDCRLLPGGDINRFVAKIRQMVADDGVEVTVDDVDESVPASPVDTALFDDIAWVIHHDYPHVIVVTPYSRAANDCRYFQAHGITSYGFVPFIVTEKELSREHGNDERVSVANVKRGVRMLYDVIARYATDVR